MKIIAFGASSSKKSINKTLATYVASLVKGAKVEVLDLNDYEYLNLEEDETNKFELKKTEVVYPDMMDVIIAAHGLLREDAKRIRLDVEIDLPCPFCEENVFMVNFPLGNYPHGYCKKNSNSIINKFSIKRYIEIRKK